MRAADLIAALENLPPDAEVTVWTSDGDSYIAEHLELDHFQGSYVIQQDHAAAQRAFETRRRHIDQSSGVVLRYEGTVPAGMRVVSRDDGDVIAGTPTVCGDTGHGRWIVKRKTPEGEVEGWTDGQ